MKQTSTAEAKNIVLSKVAAGQTREQAMTAVGRSVETFRDWMKNDAEFAASVRKIRESAGTSREIAAVPEFPEFCAKYLDKPLPFHHMRAWDVVEGRDPRDLRDSMQYQAGTSPGKYTIVNFPPDHAKSTVWNVQYCVWRICQDPNVRIITVSKSQSMAKKFLSQVKFYLQNPALFPALHAAFSPDGGWMSVDKADGLSWRENMIYVRGRTAAEKDPTLEALGVGGQIYGSRADLIILDDVTDFGTASSYENLANWIGQEVFNRLDPEIGQLLILGTRVGAMDLYRHLRDNAKDESDCPFYTYFAQPAILSGETEHSTEWEVLWPERMHRKAIAARKAAMTDPRRFTFVYQQRDVQENAVFLPEAVDASENRQRFHGPMVAGAPGHRHRGMEGLYVVASWDPASSSGRNAMIVMGTDKVTKRRWVLDVWNKKGVTPRQTIPKLKEITEKYNVNEWRIEKNAVQQFITQLPEIRDWLSVRGVRLVEHQTYGNKWDPNMGVEGTLGPLFYGCVEQINNRWVALPDGAGPIELPSARMNPHVGELKEQLKSWEPDQKRLIQDLVMALWFAELGVRQYLRGGTGEQTHLPGRFASRAAMASRVVIPINDAVAQGLVNVAG